MRLDLGLNLGVSQGGESTPVGSILAFDHPNLVAAYTMDNIDGVTLFDETANNNDGTITGATPVAGGIGLGNALDFNGSSDEVNTGIVHSGAAAAVSVWVNVDDNSTRQHFFGDYDASGSVAASRVLLEIVNSTTVRAVTGSGVDEGVNIVTWPYTFTVGAETHIVYQLSGTTAELFINGVSQGQRTFPFNPMGSGAVGAYNTAAWRIGAAGDFTSYKLNGKVNQLRRANTLYTPAEVTALYAEGTP